MGVTLSDTNNRLSELRVLIQENLYKCSFILGMKVIIPFTL